MRDVKQHGRFGSFPPERTDCCIGEQNTTLKERGVERTRTLNVGQNRQKHSCISSFDLTSIKVAEDFETYEGFFSQNGKKIVRHHFAESAGRITLSFVVRLSAFLAQNVACDLVVFSHYSGEFFATVVAVATHSTSFAVVTWRAYDTRERAIKEEKKGISRCLQKRIAQKHVAPGLSPCTCLRSFLR